MNGIAGRIAAASLAVGLAVAAILALGVFVFSAVAFERLMVEHGSTVTDAHAMFDESITRFFVGALVVAAVASVTLSVLLASRIARPLGEIGAAARRIATGDHAVRVSRGGPEEIASLADSFNQMAAEIGEQERLRREFIANAAHELRTPLTNLQGYLEALRDEVIAPERATFVSLHEEVDRLVRLARSLDDLAAGDLATSPPTLSDIDLGAAITRAVELARPSLDRRGVAAAVEVPAGLAARADPDHLAQVLANLLQNAGRYTPEGGAVTVTAARRPGDIVVSVTNTGQAIPSTELPHLFERFYRVEKSRSTELGGAGIGLAITKRLVELGGGQVGAESGAGQTRFWFSLPS
ncbi:MAG TPA: HAMP domain-containing sensor histidine kinase [Candidatus Saccharimonadales bacterium]|nr:HAMP domain-containing sensor histidine kinase [Candidatus Saccharimonadales bacterium]